MRGQLKPKGSTWHMDETFVRIASAGCICSVPSTAAGKRWTSSYPRLVIGSGEVLPEAALANPDNRVPQVFARDRLRSYPAAIRKLQQEGQLHHGCRHRTRRYSNNPIESDHRHIKRRLRSMHGPRSLATACAVVPGIEAVQRIPTGLVLGITKNNLHGQAWVLRQSDRSQLGRTRTSRFNLYHSMLLQHFPDHIYLA